MKSHKRFEALRFLLCQAAIALLAGPSFELHAADLYWDTNGTTAGFGASPAGTWGTSAFWSTSSDGTATTANTTTTTSDNIFFGTSTDGFTTNGNINFNGARSAGTITVGSANTAVLNINNATALTLASAATITVNSTTTTFQILGQISGASTSLTKAGVGTLTVAGSTSNYTGATIITGGALAAEFITNGGTASAIGASSNAASNLVLNGGMLRKINSSAQTTDRLFTLGANGGILESVGAGSIDFSNTGNIAATGTEARSLRLAGNSTAANTLAPILADASGGGIVSLVKAAVGTWTVAGNNSFTGGTTVSGGTLTMGHANALGSTSGQLTVTGGVLNMAANNLTVGNLAGTGGFIRGTSGTRLLTIGEGNGTGGNFQGSIQDGTGGTTALTKTGTGAITLSGTNTYTGATSVSAGTLAVNGSLAVASAVSVGSAAMLGGSGTIGGPVSILGGGILSPGNSPGTLTINNTLALDAASFLNFEIDAINPSSSVLNDRITGVTNLTLGGTLNLSGTGDFSTVTQGTVWRLIDYTGTLTDNTLSLGTAPTLAAGLSFVVDTSTANQVNIIVVPEPGSTGLIALGFAAAGWAARRATPRHDRHGR